MEFDHDYAISILEAVAQHPSAFPGLTDYQDFPPKSLFEHHPREKFDYHVLLLDEAGYLISMDLTDMSGHHYRPTRLTYAGHEFLATVRSKGAKEHALATAASKGAKITLPLLQQLASAFIQGQVGL